MDLTAAMIARFSSTADAMKACREYGLPTPKSSGEARRALYAYAEQGGAEAHFLFDLAAGPVVEFAKNASITPAVARMAGAAAGLPEEGIAVLQRLASSGKFKRLAVTDLPALMGRVVKRMTAGVGADEAVQFSVAEFAPANADANGVRDERMPGSHRLVAVNRGAGPVIVIAAPLNGDGPQRRVPIDAGALADWPTFQAAVKAASGGQVQLVRPDNDAAVPGCPGQLFAPVAASNPAKAGRQKKNDDMLSAPAAPAAMSAVDLAAFLREAEHRRHLDLLSRSSLGRTLLPVIAGAPEKARASAENAERAALFNADPEAYLRRVEATVAEQRRKDLMSRTALGRSQLAAEQDAGRR